MEPKIGISKKDLTSVAHALNSILADEFLLFTKTRNAHWNVEGPDFHTVHVFFEKQYGEIEEMMDEIAERIRTLGHYAPATLAGFLKLTHLTEKLSEKNNSAGFMKELLADHETIIEHMRENIKRTDEEWKDTGTSDFLTGMMETHEKMAWMLRSHLK